MSITLAPQFTQRNYRWTAWKVELLKKVGSAHQFDDSNDVYTIYFYDGPEVHLCTIWKGIIPDGIIQSGYSQGQNDTDKADFEINFKSSANGTLDKKNSNGLLLSSQEPRIGTELILVTHDFTDPTTWYTESVRVENVILTSSINNLTFSGPHDNWIDMEHGKLFDEDALKFDVEHQYAVNVFVNGMFKTPREAFEVSGGDYEVNYAEGKVLFFQPVTGAVSASYSYENGSMWSLIPDAGKKLDIEVAEAQFATDIMMNDSIEFEIWVYNPYDLPNKVKYTWTSYKTVKNFIDEALGSYPVIKGFGGFPRGIASDVYGFPFRYGTVRTLRSSQGVELRVRLKHDRKFGGSYATTTTYCTVHDE